MSTGNIKAEDVSVESFEDTDSHKVEGDFEQWKKRNPDAVILDISYRSCMSPVHDSPSGQIFSLYTITIAYAKHQKDTKNR